MANNRPLSPDLATEELRARVGDTEVDPSPVTSGVSMKAVGGSTAIIASGILVGQAFGLIRTLFVAGQVGISSSFDAILIAMVVPTILGNWLSHAMRVAIVPAFAHISHRAGEREARRFVGTVLTYLALASCVAMLLVLVFSDLVVNVSGPGLASTDKAFATMHIPVLAPMLALLALSNMLTAVCQIGRQFVPMAAAAAIGGFAGLLATVIWWPELGVTGYAVGTTIDAGITLAVLGLGAWRRGLLPRPSLRANSIDVRAFAKHVLPMTVGSAVLQLNLISDRAIATLLSIGATSALKYGQQIVSAPIAALSTSWATVIYPTVVAAGGPRSGKGMGEAMNTALKYTVVIFVPLAVATVAFAPLVVDLIYGRGAFDSESVRTTVAVVVGFAPMLVLSMIQPVLTAAHNARRRGTLMAITGISNAGLNVALNLIFGSVIGVAGIALSSSVTLAILLVWLASRVPPEEGFQPREVLITGGRALLASLVPAVPIGLIAWQVPLTIDPIVQLLLAVVGGLIGAAAYVIIARWVGLPEPLMIFQSVWTKLKSSLACLTRKATSGPNP